LPRSRRTAAGQALPLGPRLERAPARARTRADAGAMALAGGTGAPERLRQAATFFAAVGAVGREAARLGPADSGSGQPSPPEPFRGLRAAKEFFMSTRSFADLGVSRAVVASLAQQGFERPFAIQREVIGHVLDGRDVLAKSPTGSGKTLAFG